MTVAPQANQQQSQEEHVTGYIQGILDKGAGKWQVEVNTGQQNPRRLWTKDGVLVGQLAMMIGQHATFVCGVSEWTNQQGQPVRSLWINGVGTAAGQYATPSAAAPPQPQQQYVQPQPQMAQPMQVAQPQQFQQPTVVQAQVTPMQGMQPVAQMQGQAMPQVQMQEPRLSEAEREKRIHRQTATKVAAILISHVPAEQRTLDNVLALADRLVAYYEAGGGNPGAGGGQDGYGAAPHTDDDIPF